jgi:hypothetical protein
MKTRLRILECRVDGGVEILTLVHEVVKIPASIDVVVKIPVLVGGGVEILAFVCGMV